MKKLLFLMVLAASAFTAAAQGRIVSDAIQSARLGAEVKFNVYLPKDYDATQHYPVLYLLHGLSDDYTGWANKGGVKLVADELVNSGELRPLVIVMPNAGGADIHHIQNGYFNVQDWPYEDFFFQELLPAVESRYNCGGSKGQRAIAGLSMGGGGAIVYAQRHPDLFSSSFGMSPWLDNKHREVRGDDVPGSKLPLTDRSVCEHSALDFIDNADAATLEALRTVKWFIDCGDDDYLFHLSVGLHQKMKAAGVHSELRVRDGIHNWEYWHLSLRLALPFASRNFSGQ